MISVCVTGCWVTDASDFAGPGKRYYGVRIDILAVAGAVLVGLIVAGVLLSLFTQAGQQMWHQGKRLAGGIARRRQKRI